MDLTEEEVRDCWECTVPYKSFYWNVLSFDLKNIICVFANEISRVYVSKNSIGLDRIRSLREANLRKSLRYQELEGIRGLSVRELLSVYIDLKGKGLSSEKVYRELEIRGVF